MTYRVRGIRAKSGGSCPGDTCPTSDAPTTCCRSPGPTDCCVVVGRPVNLPKSRLASRAAPPRTDGESAPPRYFLPREHLLSAGAAGRTRQRSIHLVQNDLFYSSSTPLPGQPSLHQGPRQLHARFDFINYLYPLYFRRETSTAISKCNDKRTHTKRLGGRRRTA